MSLQVACHPNKYSYAIVMEKSSLECFIPEVRSRASHGTYMMPQRVPRTTWMEYSDAVEPYLPSMVRVERV